ncbi:MAG TPA: type I glutamate--ammonia ligase [Candidatus Norongarragalinales archaeon]|nr:type I glutamate--ammonia ligase [Candidatus Norongarragalinales archaeon]
MAHLNELELTTQVQRRASTVPSHVNSLKFLGSGVESLIEFAQERNTLMVDYKFIDLPGIWQHKTVPIAQFSEGIFVDGEGFDGSSIRGFQSIEESDMLLLPDPKTAFIDPFMKDTTLSITCDVAMPGKTKDRYHKDPRHVAQKAEQYLMETGVADLSYWGPELEFFVFDALKYHSGQLGTGYEIYTSESHLSSLEPEAHDRGNLGHKIRPKEGYFPVAPADTQTDLRAEMTKTLEATGVHVETQHHEVAFAQAEIDMRYDAMTAMADKAMLYKYVVKNVARKFGKTATFMPKPIFGDNGSGMHVHQSLWRGGKNLFFDAGGYAELSQMAMHYIGGLLKHADAVLAFTSPTTNSYKRLVPGYEAPVNIAFSQRNRSAAIRVPMYAQGERNSKSKRIEFRPPDATANPYLAFSAMLMAGLDGIQRKIDPVAEGYGPMDKNIYKLNDEDKKKIKSVPGSLDKALEALEADHAFLMKGNVFTGELIRTWIEYKREAEVDPVRIRPHPYEIYLYYDA